MFAFKSGEVADATFPKRKGLWCLNKTCVKSFYTD